MTEGAASASEAIVRNGVVISSEISPDEVQESLKGEVGRQLSVISPQVQRALASWAEDLQPSYPLEGFHARGDRSYWPRDRYTTPSKIFEQMALAYQALDDDIVGAVADTSEAIAFQKVSFQCDDEEQADVWSQIGRDLNLDNFLRVAWRELLTVSQFYGVRYWGRKDYRVRGDAEVRKKRKTFSIVCPTQLGFLDPTRVVPVQNDIFGEARLCWIASQWEADAWTDLESLPFTQ